MYRIKVVALLTIVLGFGFSTSTTKADQTSNTPWYDVDGTSSLFDSYGNNITEMEGFLFQLIIDPLGDTNLDGMVNWANQGIGWGIGAEDHMYSAQLDPDDPDSGYATPATYNAQDDVVIAQGNWEDWGDGLYGLYQDETPLPINTKAYIRWFSTESLPESPDNYSMVEAGLIYNDAWVSAASDTAEPTLINFAYGDAPNTGTKGIEYDGEGWQSMPMVPEPGTFALFGIGLLTVALRRRKANKSA